jgi:hypothetical protein
MSLASGRIFSFEMSPDASATQLQEESARNSVISWRNSHDDIFWLTHVRFHHPRDALLFTTRDASDFSTEDPREI